MSDIVLDILAQAYRQAYREHTDAATKAEQAMKRERAAKEKLDTLAAGLGRLGYDLEDVMKDYIE